MAIQCRSRGPPRGEPLFQTISLGISVVLSCFILPEGLTHPGSRRLSGGGCYSCGLDSQEPVLALYPRLLCVAIRWDLLQALVLGKEIVEALRQFCVYLPLEGLPFFAPLRTHVLIVNNLVAVHPLAVCDL